MFFIVSGLILAMVLTAAAAIGLLSLRTACLNLLVTSLPLRLIWEKRLDVRVPVSDRQFSEFQDLSRSFNVMAVFG